MNVLTVKIPKTLVKKFKVKCILEEKTMTEVVIKLITAYIKDKENETVPSHSS